MKLIDADELQKKFGIECAGECAICKNNNNFESCKLIDSAPIVDAVPADRLKDLCERWTDVCAMCIYVECDKCALRSCIDELKEIIYGGEQDD